MQFKLIPPKILCGNLNDFLINHYSQGFDELRQFVFLDISLERFNKIKAGKPLKMPEILEIVKDFKMGDVKNKAEILKKVWMEKEEAIFKTIKKRTNLVLSTKDIVCYLDPYTYLGFYSKGDSITISSELPLADSLMVMTHELFHIFYWKKAAELGLSDKKNLKNFEWDLSEVTAYFLLREEQFKQFWPEVRIGLYPNIKEVYDKVKDLWRVEKFEEYLINSYSALNKNE